MCGITALFNKSGLRTDTLCKANALAAHRGPDDEGFLLWRPDSPWRLYAGKDSSLESRAHHQLALLPGGDPFWQVGLGHRRLSILDLSPQGHQPMTLDGRFAITYNGEVYNYLEIRHELQALGHIFRTDSDTEVLLHAWQQWGPEALHRFNGMFAFVLLDTRWQKLYAVRDRFGIKPLYYTDRPGYLAFASEVKQLRLLPEYEFQLNEANAYDYLRNGSVDHNTETFEQGILQVGHGHYLEVDLQNNQHQLKQWYKLEPTPWKGSFEEACDRFYKLLKDSIRLRMRSDVPVGSALSGGLDSSTIVCLMREVLRGQGKEDLPIKTITSCQEDKKYDEWEYAETVIQKVRAEPYKVFPTFEKLLEDLDRFIWHMDYPFGSTSQFSQWCVFEGAAQVGLKVMIDGQGADEQLAGYGGNDMALYTGLLASGQLGEFASEVVAYNKYHGNWPVGFMIGAIQYHIPSWILNQVPDRFRFRKQHAPDWLRLTFIGQPRKGAGSLRKSLYGQVTEGPLPALLRYEDRNSMAFSIESRVPFMDYRLIEFTLGLPEHFVYRRGERKHILRKTFAGQVPEKVLARRDKMGFVSAEERWLKQEGRDWFQEQVAEAGEKWPDMLNPSKANHLVQEMVAGKKAFSFSPWRILSISRFMRQLGIN